MGRTGREKADDRLDGPSRSQRFLLGALVVALALLFAALAVRLFQLQVVQHLKYRVASERVLTRTDAMLAYRGDLRDRNGVILARDLEAWNIGLDPTMVPRESLASVVRAAADALGQPGETRQESLHRALRVEEDGGRYVAFALGVEAEVVDRVREALRPLLAEPPRLNALSVERTTRRVYPRRTLVGQVLGVLDADGLGVEGIERSQHGQLVPRPGCREVHVDGSSRLRFFLPQYFEVAPVNGRDVRLTIDVAVQGVLEEELDAGIRKHSAEAGLGVVLDCRTGAVLAMASLPTYDPNNYHRYPREELAVRRRNRVVEATYEPGSVIKPFIAAMALEHGLCSRDEVLWGGGSATSISGRAIRDVSDHGVITAEKAIVYSSNIGMSILGLRLGRDGLLDTLARFGLCQRTGVDLPFEAKGKHTSRHDWRETWTSISVSFGYECMVTPIQLCAAFGALVNGGVLMRPRIVERLEGDGETQVFSPQVIRRVISEETSRAMREILRGVITEGTGRWLDMEGFEFGGKSGTADMGPAYTKTNYLSSFEAFAPLDDPQIVVLVMVEKPRGGKYYGSVVAGPIAANVLRRVFHVHAKPRLASLGG